MINIAIVALAVMVIIPLNNLGILRKRLRNPVIKPQSTPPNIPQNVAKNGFMFNEIIMPVTEAPTRKLPSAVKSAKSKTLNVRKRPSANKTQGNPVVSMLRMTETMYGINYLLVSLHFATTVSGNVIPAEVKFAELRTYSHSSLVIYLTGNWLTVLLPLIKETAILPVVLPNS